MLPRGGLRVRFPPLFLSPSLFLLDSQGQKLVARKHVIDKVTCSHYGNGHSQLESEWERRREREREGAYFLPSILLFLFLSPTTLIFLYWSPPLSLIGSERIISLHLVVATLTYLPPNNERRQTCLIKFGSPESSRSVILFVRSFNTKVTDAWMNGLSEGG